MWATQHFHQLVDKQIHLCESHLNNGNKEAAQLSHFPVQIYSTHICLTERILFTFRFKRHCNLQ